MKKNIIILVSFISLVSVLSGCNQSENKQDLSSQNEVQENNNNPQDDEVQEEDIINNNTKEEQNTSPLEIIPPIDTNNIDLIEVNEYCKLIVHNIKNYHFEYMQDLFLNQMQVESWQEVLEDLGEFQNSIGIQTNMLVDLSYQSESAEQGEELKDIDAYQVLVKESYIKDEIEQELQIKLVLTNNLLISDLQIQIK